MSASYQERGLAALKGLSGENGQATDLSNIREPHTPNITIWPHFAHPSPGLFLFVSLFISLSVSLQTTTSPCTLNSLSSSLFVSSASLSLSHTHVEIFQKSFKSFVDRTKKFLCFRRIEEGTNCRTPVCLLPFWSQFPDSIPEVCSQDIALSGLQKPL